MFVSPPKIYLHRTFVDFRKSINSLSVIIESEMDLPIMSVSVLFTTLQKKIRTVMNYIKWVKIKARSLNLFLLRSKWLSIFAPSTAFVIASNMPPKLKFIRSTHGDDAICLDHNSGEVVLEKLDRKAYKVLSPSLEVFLLSVNSMVDEYK
jgi:hypothetical protein